MKKALLYWLPVLAYAGVIFYISSMPHIPGPDIRELDRIDPEKLVLHLLEYSVLGLLLFRAFVNTGSSTTTKRALVLATMVGFLYGVTDEAHQYFVPYRTPSLGDAIADGIGSFLGAFGKRFLE